MISGHFNTIGIQRELHIDWFDHAARLHLSGFDKRQARENIYEYLDDASG